MEVVVIEEVPSDEYDCEFCTLEFQSSEELNDHVVQHFKQKDCTGCGKTLILVGNIWFGQHSDVDCCNLTEEVYREEPDFIEVKQEEIFDIDEVNEINEDDNDIFADENVEDEEEDVEIIETHSVDDVEISAHNSTVRTEKNHCPLCNKKFRNEQHLIQHINQHNGFNAQPYSLTQLRKQKKTTDNENDAELIGLTGEQLMEGQLSEEQLNRRTCPICNKYIVNKQNLICHMNIHRGAKPFVCSVCSKSFAHIRNLVRHKEQQRHCEMQFKCNARGCKKSFMSANKLHRHKQIHLTDSSPQDIGKPYPCHQCEKSFMTLGFLKLHLKRHNNE